MNLSTPLGRLRLTALTEGISFLLILFVTMPLKYGLGIPEPNLIIGMGHGILFVLYVALVLYMRPRMSWDLKDTFFALLASVIPFGTFWADKKLFREANLRVRTE